MEMIAFVYAVEALRFEFGLDFVKDHRSNRGRDSSLAANVDGAAVVMQAVC